jgi:hypothetical protein
MQLEKNFPSVLDKSSEITIYDRLYGEVLCMKAWAYWNAVRIYKKVPYIWPSLNEISEIDNYVCSILIPDMSLHTYVSRLIEERNKLCVANSGDVQKAIDDKSYIAANAKAEQILDDLVALYQVTKYMYPTVAEFIKGHFKNTYYINCFN